MHSEVFCNFSAKRLQQLMDRIAVCFDKLTEEQVWHRGSEAENTLGNLMVHLHGNLGQFILAGVGGAPDTRRRDAEFTVAGGLAKRQLLDALQQRVSEAVMEIQATSAERLLETIEPQPGRVMTVLETIYMAVTHFDEHAGQVYWATKQFTQEPLHFTTHDRENRQPTELESGGIS